VRLEVLTAVMKIQVFWDVMSCRKVKYLLAFRKIVMIVTSQPSILGIYDVSTGHLSRTFRKTVVAFIFRVYEEYSLLDHSKWRNFLEDLNLSPDEI